MASEKKEKTNKKSKKMQSAKAVTLLRESRTDERHPEVNPQTPHGAARKLREETAEGHGVVDTAKRVLEEADRQISGEYERREQPE